MQTIIAISQVLQHRYCKITGRTSEEFIKLFRSKKDVNSLNKYMLEYIKYYI